MEPDVREFDFEYAPTQIAYGRNCIQSIGEKLADRGLYNALIVCGSNVGANDALMEPLTDGLGDALAGVFDETTPQKTLETTLDGVERIREDRVDAIVGVGGGSSLDVAKAMSVMGHLDSSRSALVEETRRTGFVPTPDPDEQIVPLYVVPTTMAGADMTSSGGITIGDVEVDSIAEAEDRGSATTTDPRLMPEWLFYDPGLFATTPTNLLTASAMNGFDKGIETLYSRSTTPQADAHSVHGLRFLRSGLLGLADAGADDEALHRSIVGIVLVQYGCQPNIIHAFGNGVSYHFDVQQGAVHGIMAPPVLRYVFENSDGRRHLLGEALGIDGDAYDDALADCIVDEVTAIRDALGLPSRLQAVEDLQRDDLNEVADVISGNFHFGMAPPTIEPDVAYIEDILQEAW